MNGKKRPGAPTPETLHSTDIHVRIKEHARRLDNACRPGLRDARATPEVRELLEAALEVLGEAVPSSFVFRGRRYWLQAKLTSELQVFAGPAEASPLVAAVNFGRAAHGHRPGH